MEKQKLAENCPSRRRMTYPQNKVIAAMNNREIEQASVWCDVQKESHVQNARFH